MKIKLPESISSAQDLDAVILEVQNYNRWFSHEAIKKRTNVKSISDKPNLSTATNQLINDIATHKSLNQESLDNLLTTLKRYQSQAPSITLTLAALPTASIKSTLVGWCRDNIAPDVLVNFRFNSTLLGGMVLTYGSRIFDWSFKRQILASRDQFPEVLKNV